MNISKKKTVYPINEKLSNYLIHFKRAFNVPILYEDLLRFSGSINVYDKNDLDTLWIRVFYEQYEREEIEEGLKQAYMILHSDGNQEAINFLNIDAIDYCTFGNSKPFRIKIRNILNDNYTYIYVKIADASRIYGLELEHLFSPNRINFIFHKQTLIEEHIAGIPGDVFINNFLDQLDDQSQSQIAKEFVKFNERCQMRLLGDMRSYNYVIVPTHDFDTVQYRIRCIDFDQQCYEGRLKIYQPQFFKENNKMVSLVSKRLQSSSVEQYKKEERAILAKRILNAGQRVQKLMNCMKSDSISRTENIKVLRNELYQFTLDKNFKNCTNMGEILEVALNFVSRNYENIKMQQSYL